jgi:hypothetical protein
VATRFDKLAGRYQATACVADIFIWLRARPDRTRSSAHVPAALSAQGRPDDLKAVLGR